MGNSPSASPPSLELLADPIEELEGRLFWPSQPYEGPVKLRFCCDRCSQEAVLLQPYPETWKDLVGSRGECFACGSVQKIKTKFIEAGTREPIWVFNGRDDRVLAQQILKFIRSAPPSHRSYEAGSRVHFEKVLRPANFRDSVLPHDFLWEDEALQLQLKERHKLFLQTARKNIKTWDRFKVRIDRHSNILSQAYKQFSEVAPNKIRGSFSVKFLGEEAMDLGGVTKEFFHLVSEQMLDPRANLFIPQGPNNTFHPSPSSAINELHLEYFRFFGRFLGKALIEERLVKAPLTRAIWKLLLGKPLTFEDFQTVDKQIYMRLLQMLDFDDETLESCHLVFAADIDDFGQPRTVPLKEGGEDIPVTRDNLIEWISLYSSWRMLDSVAPQLVHLLQGFYEVVPVQVISLFNEFELEQILCGLGEINVDDWRKHAVMIGYRRDEDKVQEDWFWEILTQDFNNTQRGQVLQFVTGSAQVPVSFQYLHPRFTVALVRGLKKDSFPYGHTCFNRVDFPVYSSKEKMRAGLLKALDLGLVGFALR